MTTFKIGLGIVVGWFALMLLIALFGMSFAWF